MPSPKKMYSSEAAPASSRHSLELDYEDEYEDEKDIDELNNGSDTESGNN